VPIAWELKGSAELAAFHVRMLRFWSRFDSMAVPSMDDRITQAWEWTGSN
jgi:hypothetical protein